jgi:hypothetical protein
MWKMWKMFRILWLCCKRDVTQSQGHPEAFATKAFGCSTWSRGANSRKRGMDAISQDVRRMFGVESGGSITPEGMHAMLEETLARLSSHGISTRIVDSEDMDALLQEQDEPFCERSVFCKRSSA